MGDDEELAGAGDFYHVPLRNTNTQSTRGHRRTASASSNATTTTHKPNGSVSSFADFVSAPGRNSRRAKNNNFGSMSIPGGSGRDRELDIEEEVLFDEDEATYVSGSSRTHSKIGTEGSSTAASTDEERGKHGSD